MVVVTLVGAAHDHDGEVLARVDAVVVHGGLEEMTVLVKPLGEVEWRCKRHDCLSWE